ncbi:MAG: sulfotransferase [Balneolaceae bacterium]
MEKAYFPHFIIGGAAKSGTTSLSRYLDQLPGLFIPEREPNFFTYLDQKSPYDIKNHEFISGFHSYFSLMKPHEPQEDVILGEKSVSYLYKDYYQQVIGNIKKNHPFWEKLKWIFILRNPTERAYSQYIHNLNFHEELSFKDAIEQWPERKAAGWIPAYDYLGAGFYSESIQAYLKHFEQVRIYLFDDLMERPLWLMSDIMKFLNIEASPKNISFAKYNSSGIPRNKLLKIGLPLLSTFYPLHSVINRIIPSRVRLKIRKFTHQKPLLPASHKKELYSYYSAEIKQLETIIKRDLSDWNYGE